MEIKSINLQDYQARRQKAVIENTINIKSLQDLKTIDINQLKNLDPEKLNLGTELQDAAIIARAYERGAHYTPTEAAVFTSFNRHLDNYRNISQGITKMLESYVMIPEDTLAGVVQQTDSMVRDTQTGAATSDGGNVMKVDRVKLYLTYPFSKFQDITPQLPIPIKKVALTGGADGTGRGGQEFAQSWNVGDQQHVVKGTSNAGDEILSWIKDCIPCDLRINSWLELNPHVDLSKILKAALKGILDFLNSIADLLRNLDVFGDFCSLMDLFNFLCIPDLQRILMLFAALLMWEAIDLEGFFGILQMLIAPLFMPIFAAITGILDQFSLLVANPLECIVDAINEQIEKLPREDNPIFSVISHDARKLGVSDDTVNSIRATEKKVSNWVGYVDDKAQAGMASANAAVQQVGQALSILKGFVEGGIDKIRELLQFYLGDFLALLEQLGGTDAAYIGASMRKLQLVRLISFIVALITALKSGDVSFCQNQGPAEAKEIDTFFNNYLNPNSPFAIYIDNDGQIHLDEKIDNLPKSKHSLPQNANDLSQKINNLPKRENVFEFEGRDLVSPDIAMRAREVSDKLSSKIKAIKPCRLQVSTNEAETLNKHIAELSKL